MRQHIQISTLTVERFAPFGDVLKATGQPDMLINQDLCGRYHDRAALDFGPAGRAGVSIFKAENRKLPLDLEMVERHPEGSQAFIPMSEHPFLVVVAPDENGKPGQPLAFLTESGQGINIHRNIWHGVLCPLGGPGIFAVIDRIGNTDNLEEYWYDPQYVVN